MIRSPLDYKRIFEGKSRVQIAEQIIGDLVGYRKTSRKRSDDLDQLMNALQAFATVTLDNHYKRVDAS